MMKGASGLFKCNLRDLAWFDFIVSCSHLRSSASQPADWLSMKSLISVFQRT